MHPQTLEEHRLNSVITISRQYGSGGRFIAKKLAEKLGVPYFDNEIITMAAKESGYTENIFEKAGIKCGVIGTLGTVYDTCKIEPSLTTPDAIYLAASITLPPPTAKTISTLFSLAISLSS